MFCAPAPLKFIVEVAEVKVPLTTKGVPVSDKLIVLAPAPRVVLAPTVSTLDTVMVPCKVLVPPVDVFKL